MQSFRKHITLLSSLSKNLKPLTFKNLPHLPFTTIFLSSSSFLKRNFSTEENDEKNSKKLVGDLAKLSNMDEVSEDTVFTDKEQRISFKLLNAKSPEEVFNLYKVESADTTPLTADTLSLIFYFLCSFKEDIKDNPLFEEILNKILINLQEVSTVYFLNLLWSLGIYRYTFQMALKESDKDTLNKIVENKIDSFNFQQISSIAFALFQIYSEQQDQPRLYKLLQKCSEILLENEMQITKIDIINFLIIFLSSGYRQEKILLKFSEILMKISGELTEEEIDRIFSLLSELKFDDKKLYIELIERFLELKEPHPNSTCNIIFGLSNMYPEEKTLLKSLLKIVHSQYIHMNITSYINIWLALSKFKVYEKEFTQTIDILKTVPFESKVFSWKDLEGYEMVNIVVALSVMRINDKSFINELIKELKNKLDSLAKEELMNLARSFVIYVRLFEEFFLLIHLKCCEKFKEFTKSEKETLKKTFHRVRVLIPESPFVDNTAKN